MPIQANKANHPQDGYVDISAQLFDDGRLAALEIALYACMAMYADPNLGRCSVPVGTLAIHLNVNEKTVRKSTKVLERTGYITCDRQLGSATVFTLRLPKIDS